MKIDKESGNKDILGTWIGDIGLVYYERGEKNKALDYYLKALNLDEETGNKNNTATWLGCIGKVYTDQKKYKDAFNYLYHSIAISKSISSMDEIELRYECLSRLYEKSDIPLPDTIGGKLLNIEQMRLRSLYYYKRSIEIRDTLFSQENKKQWFKKK